MEPIGGGLTAPAGWAAGAVYTGVRAYGPEPRFDLGLLLSETPAAAAGLFTRNAVTGAPVELTRERVAAAGAARALAVNSGNSNVATGEAGRADARRMAALAAARLGVGPGEVLVASTGVIGRRLPMDRIGAGIAAVEVRRDGGRGLRARDDDHRHPPEGGGAARRGGRADLRRRRRGQGGRG